MLKSKQENWQRIVDKDLLDPKDIIKSALVGDDFVLWEKQNNHVNVLLGKLITKSAGISIFVKSQGNLDLSTCYTPIRTVYARSIIEHSLVKSKPSIPVFKLASASQARHV